jgi:hypothetical protein
MYLDAQNLYSDAQVLGASAASDNVINHGVARQLSIGEPMAVLIVVDTDGDLDDSDNDETYTAKLQTDSDEAFGSPTDITPAYSLPRGSVAGTRFVIPLVPGVAVEQFTRLYFTTGGTSPSGTVTAALVPANFIGYENVYYPEAVDLFATGA